MPKNEIFSNEEALKRGKDRAKWKINTTLEYFKNTTYNYNIKLYVDSLIILFLFSQYLSSAFKLYKESCWDFPSGPVADSAL